MREYRRRGLASALLARAFRVLHERGRTDVTAEVDDTNMASRSLMVRLGARRNGGSLEVIARQRECAASVPWVPEAGDSCPGDVAHPEVG